MSQTDRTAGLVGNAAFKAPCRAASAANVASLSGEQTVGGVALTTGDRVLLKNQTTTSQNGIWVVDTGAWTRAQDFDGAYDTVTGTLVPVYNGIGTYAAYALVGAIDTFDSDAITFELVDSVSLAAMLASSASIAVGDALLAVKSTLANAVATTQHEINEQTKSLFNFMTVAQIADVVANTTTLDVTTAINNALASGVKRIRAPAGTYKYTTPLLPASNCEIFGDGDSTIFKGAANCDCFQLNGLSNVVLRDFKIDGVRGSFTSSGNDAIFVNWVTTAGSNVKIRHVTIRDAAGAGVIALASSGQVSSDLYIEDCDVQDIGAHGIIAQDYISNVWIRRNRVKNSGLLVADRPGITASRNGSFLVIDDNVCIGSAAALGTSCHGISLDTTSHVSCKGNVVSGWTKGFGIEVGFCTNAAITGNAVTGCKGDIVLSGVEASSRFNQNITITGNTSHASVGSTGGIYSFMTGATGALLHKNIVVSGNAVDGATLGSGINMTFCDKLVVSGNSVFSNFLSGIYVVDSKNVAISGNVSVNNNCASIKTISSLTQSAGTATATSVGHGYATNDVVTIFGAVPSEYNGAYSVTVTGSDTFTYIHTAPAAIASPAAGTIECSKSNSASHGGIRAQWSTITTKEDCAFGVNLVERNGTANTYNVGVNGIFGFINGALILKESNTPRVENLTSGVNSNEEDRAAIFMKNNKISVAYNNAGTRNYVTIDLDGSDTSWSNSSTEP